AADDVLSEAALCGRQRLGNSKDGRRQPAQIFRVRAKKRMTPRGYAPPRSVRDPTASSWSGRARRSSRASARNASTRGAAAFARTNAQHEVRMGGSAHSLYTTRLANPSAAFGLLNIQPAPAATISTRTAPSVICSLSLGFVSKPRARNSRTNQSINGAFRLRAI